MKITELENKIVKVSAGSITAKKDGKTCGVVRNVCRLSNLQPSKRFDIVSRLKKSGIVAMKAGIDNIVIDGKEIYYIVQAGTKQEFCEKFEAAGYTVIRCAQLS